MTSNLKKIILTSFVVICSIFFINIDDVKAAECKCYYYGEHKANDIIGHDTMYALQMVYDTNRADIVSLCEAWMNTNGDGHSSACVYQNSVKRGNPFEVNSARISEQGCTKSACETAGLTFWSQNESKEIVTEGYNGVVDLPFLGEVTLGWQVIVDLHAITQQQYENLVASDDVQSSSEEQGIGESNITGILNWGQYVETEGGEYTLEDVGDACGFIDTNLRDLLNRIFWYISIAGIVLLIVMTAISFIKAITGSDDEKLRDAFKHLLIRAIAVVVLLLLPVILTAIIDIINNNSGGEVIIGADGNPTCSVGTNN